MLAEVLLTTSDWVTLGCFIAGQTCALGAIVWRVASRIQTIESKLDLLVASEIANLKARVDRVENRLDQTE